MPPPDYHTHTLYSCDCKASMEAMCEGAIAAGITEIGFTEHYDLHPAEMYPDWFRVEPWAAELERCRAKFAGQLTIRAGIELGEPHLFQAEAQAMLARYPFDYALGSLHWVGSISMFDDKFFRATPAPEAFGLFFAELERMTAVGNFNSLSHFDVFARTALPVYGHYDPHDYEALIRPVLQNCIERNIALDLNTAALRRRANVLTPSLPILQWYAQMGGRHITLGSDAHRPDHIAANFPEAIATLRAAGLEQVTVFEKGVGRLVPLAA